MPWAYQPSVGKQAYCVDSSWQLDQARTGAVNTLYHTVLNILISQDCPINQGLATGSEAEVLICQEILAA